MNNAEVQKLYKEVEELRNQLRDRNHENTSLSNQVEQLKEDNVELKQDKRDLRAHNEILKNEMVRFKEELQIERAEKDEYRQRIVDLEDRLDRAVAPVEEVAVQVKVRSPSLEVINLHKALPKSARNAIMDIDAGPSRTTRSLGKRKALSTQGGPSKKPKQAAVSAAGSAGPTVVAGVAAATAAEEEPFPHKSRALVKFKIESALTLPLDVVDAYLKDAPHLDIHPEPSHLHVKRQFLRLQYGGSDQQFLQYIKADKNPSGAGGRRLVFPMPDMNPAMPMQPGDSGLLFASRHEVLKNPPWGVFRRHLNGKDAEWLYLGEYESQLVGKMTAEQFREQRSSVQRSWAKLLMAQKAHECYTSMRARIALRKMGIFPTDYEDANDDMIQAEMDNIMAGRGHEVSEDDIIAAFSRGDEGIDIILMQCVSYDHGFAMDIEAQYTRFPAMKLSAKKRKAVSASGDKPFLSSTSQTKPRVSKPRTTRTSQRAALNSASSRVEADGAGGAASLASSSESSANTTTSKLKRDVREGEIPPSQLLAHAAADSPFIKASSPLVDVGHGGGHGYTSSHSSSYVASEESD